MTDPLPLPPSLPENLRFLEMKYLWDCGIEIIVRRPKKMSEEDAAFLARIMDAIRNVKP